MLVGHVDFPGAGQLASSCIAGRKRAAEDAITADAIPLGATRQVVDVAAVSGVPQILGSTLGVVDLADEIVAGRDERRIDLKAAAHDPAPRIAGVTGNGESAVVAGIDLMQGAHDLRTAPGLVDTQIADDVRLLPAAVPTSIDGVANDHAVGAGVVTPPSAPAAPLKSMIWLSRRSSADRV